MDTAKPARWRSHHPQPGPQAFHRMRYMLDTQIAAHALALGVTLVSNNTREFERVPGLLLAHWAG